MSADTVLSPLSSLSTSPSGPTAEAGRRASRARRRAERRAETRRTRGLLLGRSRAARVLAFLILAFLSLGWLLPLAWAVDTSLKSEVQAQGLPLRWFPEGGFTLENYRVVFERGEVFRWMANTLLIASAVTVLTVVICALAGYAFSRTVFRGRRTLFALTIALIMVPGQILIVPLFKEMVVLNAVDTFAGVILPQLVAPMMVYIFKQYFDQIPQEVEDAARVDGAGNWRLFWNVVLPISRPIVTAVAIFVFIGAWNNFMWPFIVTNNPDLMTLPVGLSTVKNAYGIIYAQTMAAAMIAALPLTILFMLFQRHIIKAVATTGLGGQ